MRVYPAFVNSWSMYTEELTSDFWSPDFPWVSGGAPIGGDLLTDISSTKSDVIRVADRSRRIKQGLSASTDFSSSTKSLKWSPSTGSYWITRSGHVRRRCLLEGVNPAMLTPFGSQITLEQTQLITARAQSRFIQALKEKRKTFSGPTFLGELRDTIRGIRRPATGFIKGLDRLARNIGKVRRGIPPATNRDRKITIITEAAQQSWLEFSFGVRPLVADTIDIVKAIVDFSYKRASPVVRGQDHLSLEGGFDALWTYLGYVPVVETRRLGHRSEVYGDTIYGRLTAQAVVPLDAANRVRTLLGFSLDEFVPTITELIPYSWLADYFANVTAVLTAATADRSTLSWCSRATYHNISSDMTTEVRAVSPSALLQAGNANWGTVQHTSKSFTRQASFNVFDVDVVTYMPGSTSQILNMWAAVSLLFRNLERP